MRPLSKAEFDAAVVRVRAFAPDRLTFDDSWLRARGAKAVAEPSGTYLEQEALEKFVRLLESEHQDEVLLITYDDDAIDPFGRMARVERGEMRMAVDEFFGLAYCILPSAADLPICLVTTADYRLWAASPSSLLAALGPLVEVKKQFIDWARDPNPAMRDILANAARQMHWIEDCADRSKSVPE